MCPKLEMISGLYFYDSNFKKSGKVTTGPELQCLFSHENLIVQSKCQRLILILKIWELIILDGFRQLKFLKFKIFKTFSFSSI